MILIILMILIICTINMKIFYIYLVKGVPRQVKTIDI